jgi:hypothetical protein
VDRRIIRIIADTPELAVVQIQLAPLLQRQRASIDAAEDADLNTTIDGPIQWSTERNELDVYPDLSGISLYFRDPAGNSVELVTPGVWGLPSGW